MTVMDTNTAPEVATKPCKECPWRRESAAGWLGPHTPEQWGDLASSDEPIACHMTLTDKGWQSPGVRQCAGAAIYRGNICKMTYDGVARLPADRDLVFANRQEFLAHHRRTDVSEPILATHIECIECDEIFELLDPMPADEAEDEFCENDDGHAVTPKHITTEPLNIEGLPDSDYYHHGRERYEYDMQDVNEALHPSPPVERKPKPKKDI